MILRSMLFVPCHILKYMEKAKDTEADAIIFDLEDSVPLQFKEVARRNLVDIVSRTDFGKKKIFVRLNDRYKNCVSDDLEAAVIDGIDGFLISKIKTIDDADHFIARIGLMEAIKHFECGRFKVISLIEMARAVLNPLPIVDSSDRIVGLAFGCEDFLADLQGIPTESRSNLYVPRALVGLAGRASRTIPIDTVYTKIADLDGFRKECISARELGFSGKLCVHPSQAVVANECFTPSEEEVKDAKETIRLFELAKKEGRGVNVYNGKFIGPPFVIRANRILELAREIEELNG